MERRQQLIFKKHEKNFKTWHEIIRNYQELSIIPYNPFWIGTNQSPPSIEALLHLFLEIFTGFSGSGAWTRGETLDYRTGFRTCILSEKTGQHYCLSIDKESIFLEAFIAHPECIPKIFDLFVQKVADFSRFGLFSYWENELLSDITTQKYRALLKPKIKGELPLLFRKFFIAQAEQYFDLDLGTLQINWPLDKYTIQEFLTEGCESFKVINELNVALWKKHSSMRARRQDF